MIYCCWSVKGGSGTSVVAATLALLASRQHPDVLLIDLAGDQANVLATPNNETAIDKRNTSPRAELGVFDWLQSKIALDDNALNQLLRPVDDSLQLLPAGYRRSAPISNDRWVDLLSYACRWSTVVVDAGSIGAHSIGACRTNATGSDAIGTSAVGTVASDTDGLGFEPFLRGVDQSLLVVRNCYLALRRAPAKMQRTDGVVMVRNSERTIDVSSVAAFLGYPVVAVVPDEPLIGRAVDVGLSGGRLPRSLARAVAPLLSLSSPQPLEVLRRAI
jgi:hypothetical protein